MWTGLHVLLAHSSKLGGTLCQSLLLWAHRLNVDVGLQHVELCRTSPG